MEEMPTDRDQPEPEQPGDPKLREAAEAWGVESEYWDIWSKKHRASPEAQAAILASIGVDASSPETLDQAIEEKQWREWSAPLPPTLVVGQGESPALAVVSLPAERAGAIASLEIRWEGGGEQGFDADLAGFPVIEEISLRGRRFVRKQIPLPGGLKIGYHELTFRSSGESAPPARFIVCPERAHQPEWLHGRRAAGIAVSLYGVRSARNWGCGDFTDLKALVEWAASEPRASFIALNPLHAIPNRQPYNTSPYLPNSTFYKNPIYLDLERIEDFQAGNRGLSSGVAREIADLRGAPFVEYERVARLKMRFLKALFRRFLERDYRRDTERARAFRAYADREGQLLSRFALYCALDEAIHKGNQEIWNWRAWPEPYRDPESPKTAEFERQHWRGVLFHKYIQWQIDIQLEQAHRLALERGLAIGLYHDLALATDSFGSDLWAHRPFYTEGCRVGAPPDDFSPKGQDWGFPPPNSQRHFEDGYRLFAESIRKNCRHGGALRIDHVMRFFRLYWVPNKMDASEGTYVQDRYRDLLRILALESVRNNVLIVGEDLGTAPDEFRQELARFGILSYRLFYFEQDKQHRFHRPDEYPRQALVSATTHDLPTLAGFWLGRDIEARREAGVLPDDDAYRRMREEREREKQKILDLLIELRFLPDWFPREVTAVPELTGELHNAVIGFLASTPSQLLLVNQEDLFKETEQQNLPGTTSEYPNWRRKMRYSVEELRASPEARACAAMFRDWVKRTGRGIPER
jgi:4-alpha-glucanotransferase